MDKKTVVKPVHAVAGLVLRSAESDELLLAKRPTDGLLGGLWELPGTELASPRSARKKALALALEERAGLAVEIGDLIATVEHQFTHRRLCLEIFATSLTGDAPTDPMPGAFYQALSWVSRRAAEAPALGPSKEHETPLSTLTRKVLAAVGRA